MGQLNIVQRAWYKAETNYGGGDGGAEYAKTHPSAVDSLTSFNYLVSGNFKGKNIKKGVYSAPGMAIGSELVGLADVEYPEVEVTFALQTAVEEFLINGGGITGTKGTIGPKTYIIQVQVPDPVADSGNIYYNLFGCQLTSWKTSGSYASEDVPLVTLKFTCYDCVANTGSEQTNAYPTGVVNEWEDITVTVDSDVIVELDSFDVMVENEFSNEKVNANHTLNRIKPMLLGKKTTIKLEFYKDVADRMADIYKDSSYLYGFIWTDATNTLTLTNCFTDDSNILTTELKTTGLVKYSMDIKSANSVYS